MVEIRNPSGGINVKKFLAKMHIWQISVIFFIFILLFLIEAIITPHLNYTLPFVGYGGTFKYPVLQISGLSVSLYKTAMTVGIAFMILTCLYRAEKFQIKKIVAILTAIMLAIFGYIGAKILYIIENLNYIKAYGITSAGVSFFGTVFFMPIFITFMALLFKKKIIDFLDYCTPSGLVMLTCVRLGCFMNGCCHGKTIWLLNRPVTIPAQLIECLFDILLLEIILRLESHGFFKGKMYALFMGGYGIIRFGVEFIRDTPKNILHLSNGQWFSCYCLIICIIVLLLNKNNSKVMVKRKFYK